MLEIVNVNDSRAVRNKDNILGLYEMMINKSGPRKLSRSKRAPRTSSTIRSSPMVQKGLQNYFSRLTTERAKARVVVHRIIALDDYVWAKA